MNLYQYQYCGKCDKIQPMTVTGLSECFYCHAWLGSGCVGPITSPQDKK